MGQGGAWTAGLLLLLDAGLDAGTHWHWGAWRGEGLARRQRPSPMLHTRPMNTYFVAAAGGVGPTQHQHPTMLHQHVAYAPSSAIICTVWEEREKKMSHFFPRSVPSSGAPKNPNHLAYARVMMAFHANGDESRTRLFNRPSVPFMGLAA